MGRDATATDRSLHAQEPPLMSSYVTMSVVYRKMLKQESFRGWHLSSISAKLCPQGSRMKYQSTLQSMDFASVGGHGMLLRLGGAVLSGGGSGAGGWAWLCGPRAGTMSFCSAVPPPSAELFVLTKEGTYVCYFSREASISCVFA
nr:uncharacterized protein LOC127307244 [Lolium perenne]